MKLNLEKIYPLLYSSTPEDFEKSSEETQKSFIFQGSSNWDMYYTKLDDTIEHDIYKNVELIGLNDEDDANNYNVAKNKVLEFSREHHLEIGIEKYFLLIQK